ncbi:MAG: MFS transporter [Coriobacteriales bacterium]|jgi:AAHS family benzoate transporter-like MFS transporter|nr:MFS transporter [Coriobacteriales bacterium]
MRKVNVSELIAKAKLNRFFITVFLVTLLVFVANGYGQGVFGVAMPNILTDPTAPTNDAVVLGLVVTCTLVGMFFGSLVFGVVADKIGRPKTLAICMVLFCAGNGLIGIASTEAEFFIYRVAAGFGLAGVVPVCFAIVSEYSPLKHRAALTSYVSSGVPIGQIIAPLLAMLILPVGGWRWMFLTAFLPLVFIVLVFAFLPESMERLVGQKRFDKVKQILKKAVPLFGAADDDEYVTASSQVGKTKSSLADLFKGGMARTTLLFWVAFICMMFFTYGMSTWLPQMMIQAGFPVANSLIFMFLYTAGSVPGIFVSGLLVGRLGYKKCTSLYIAIVAISMMLLALRPDVLIMYILLFLCGWGLFGSMAIIYTYLSISYPIVVRSTGVGFAAGIGRIGGSIAPMAGGFLAAAGTPLAVNFLFFAAFAVVACVAIILTKGKVAD